MQKKPIDLPKMPAPRVEIINLIDVLITLIAFFLLTTVFAEYRDHLQVDLPQVEQIATSHKIQEGLVIGLDEDNNIFLNQQSRIVTKEELIGFLSIEATHNPVVTIQADKDCSYDQVIRLLELVQGCGIESAALDVRRY